MNNCFISCFSVTWIDGNGHFKCVQPPPLPLEGTRCMVIMECSDYCLETRNLSSIKINSFCLPVSLHVYFPSTSVSDTIT